ncbi:MAG: 3-dehydroquinate synthase [Candidatus Omnitrophota bacterium]
MKTITVNLPDKRYRIVIGQDMLTRFPGSLEKLALGSEAVVISTPVIRKFWGGRLLSILTRGGYPAHFEEVADSEKSKSAETFINLLNRVAAHGKSRKIFIIAFGGGVVGDLAGFVAAVYHRGVPYVQLPTTLVAQVDSSIGGKVAIDLAAGKNLAGSFHQPRLVFSEIGFLETLPVSEIRNGLAEVIKYGVIADAGLFAYTEKNLNSALARDLKTLETLVSSSSLIKARIVEEDEFDRRDRRIILNYGHTLGHAIEAAGGYTRYSHGAGVALGMIGANYIAVKRGLMAAADASRIARIIAAAGLPTRIDRISAERIYEAHFFDKKFTNGKNRFVLPEKIGKTRIVENVPALLIRGAIRQLCGREERTRS